MADPLSIIGTAAGLVSLGLQVYGGIKDYLDAVQTSQEDIASIFRHTIGLKDALDSIDGVIRSRRLSIQTSAPAAMTCLLSCHVELNALSEVLGELSSSPSISSTNVLRTKISEGRKKLMYPFKRSSIIKLEDRIRNANLTLQTALQALKIDLLANLSDAVCDNRIQSDTVAAGVMLLRSEATSINASINTMNQSLPMITEEFHALGPLIATESRNILSQMQRDGRALNQNMSHLENQIGASLLSQKSQLERIEAHLYNRLQDERLARVEEILAGLELTGSPGREYNHTTRNLGRLVSKPDNLKSLCDEFTTREAVSKSYHSRHIRTENFGIRTRKAIRSGCSCGFARNQKKRYTRWGSLLLYHEESCSAIPFCDCERSEFDQPESSRTLGATYFGSLLRRAIGITLSMRHGAGGASLSAHLVHYHVVDDNTAPAFQLVEELEDAISSCRYRRLSLGIGDIGKLFEECSFRMRHLYRTGKAGPKDITLSGRTVLHLASDLTHVVKTLNSHVAYKFLKHFILDLLNYGVPAGVCDFQGDTPFASSLTLAKDDTSLQECVAIYDLLFSEEADFHINTWSDTWRLHCSYRNWREVVMLMLSFLPAAEGKIIPERNDNPRP
ncbi:hypothetical protein EG329_005709 [Mollisiaceae sp. DMI_Dod_QoI]|nr:hypothetical protein EG329_005709 [Helotiales sp. DMI_Dod_QoI]